jgi:hypothetical protein
MVVGANEQAMSKQDNRISAVIWVRRDIAEPVARALRARDQVDHFVAGTP